MEIDGDEIEAGLTALARGDWMVARAEFERALARAETAAGYEGFGAAASWLEDVPTAFGSRRRAYHLYRADGDDIGAARVAVALAWDHFLAGESAICTGWVERARHLLAGREDVPETVQLHIFEAHRSLLVERAPLLAEKASIRAGAVARSLGVGDLEMLALAYQGFSLVDQGRIQEGMTLVDEAATAALAGEVRDPEANASCCCVMIYACERVHDFSRAAEWCHRLQEVSETWSWDLMRSICRSHYAGVLIWRGRWDEAERELVTALTALEVGRPGEAAGAVVHLGELRSRQGRFEEAAELFASTEREPLQMQGSILGLKGRARLAWELGDVDEAAALADRFVRQLGPGNRVERVEGLELLARALAAGAGFPAAEPVLAELTELAARVGTEPVRGAASMAAGGLARARDDVEGARRAYEDAVEHFRRSGGTYEEASARLGLAASLADLGRMTAAVNEAQAGYRTLRKLGATPAASRAAALLREWGGVVAESVDLGAEAHLTPRETEILRLLASGLSNQQIAGELVLSVRTVERHVGSLYQKLGLEGGAARARATAFALTRGLA